MRRLILPILLIAAGSALGAPFDDCKEFVAMGVPGKKGTPLCRVGYALAHDPVRKTPIWVAEYVTKARAGGRFDRTDNFAADPDLPKEERAEKADYKGSGWERGHMSPAEDNAWSEEAMNQSFYLSNMVPQHGPGMNGGIWARLEAGIRNWAKDREALYVYTGPIYPKGIPSKRIGKGKVAVPSYLYKIVYDPKANEAIAFIMPNKRLKTSDTPNYIVAIEEVEKKTGLTFLTELSTRERKAIVTKKASGLWE